MSVLCKAEWPNGFICHLDDLSIKEFTLLTRNQDAAVARQKEKQEQADKAWKETLEGGSGWVRVSLCNDKNGKI